MVQTTLEQIGIVTDEDNNILGRAQQSGLYTFSFADGSAVQARFTFVYRWNGQRRMIVEHHSSGMPE